MIVSYVTFRKRHSIDLGCWPASKIRNKTFNVITVLTSELICTFQHVNIFAIYFPSSLRVHNYIIYIVWNTVNLLTCTYKILNTKVVTQISLLYDKMNVSLQTVQSGFSYLLESRDLHVRVVRVVDFWSLASHHCGFDFHQGHGFINVKKFLFSLCNVGGSQTSDLSWNNTRWGTGGLPPVKAGKVAIDSIGVNYNLTKN